MKKGKYPLVLYRNKFKRHGWARYMNGRIHQQNNNNLVSVVGATGSGKTYTAISICQIMSQLDGIPFTIDHVVFSLTELMKLINSNKLRRGSKIVFDEPQISIGARDFQSKANKVFNYLVSTFRHRNLTLLFCTPFEKLLDKSTRKLFHMRFQTHKIIQSREVCRILPYYLEHVTHQTEPYIKKLRINFVKNGEPVSLNRVDYWDVPKPSDDFIEEYEKKKRKFTDTLNKNILKTLSAYEEEGKTMTKSDDVNDDVNDDKYSKLNDQDKMFLRIKANGGSKEMIRRIMDLPESQYHKIRVKIEKLEIPLDKFSTKYNNKYLEQKSPKPETLEEKKIEERANRLLEYLERCEKEKELKKQKN